MFLCVESLEVHTADGIYACEVYDGGSKQQFFSIQYSLLIKYKSTEILADKTPAGSTLRATWTAE